MNDMPMKRVDPTRWTETRRRIGLVREYLAGERSAERRERAATELGVTQGQFLRIARAWRETGDPARIHGAHPPDASRRRGRIGPEGELAMDRALNRLGSAARLTDVVREVNRICEAEGVKPPGDGTIYERLNRRRREAAASSDEPPSLVIARCWPALPIAAGGDVVRAVALLAVLMPEGIVAAAEIGTRGSRALRIDRLVCRLARISGDVEHRPVLVQPSIIELPGETNEPSLQACG